MLTGTWRLFTRREIEGQLSYRVVWGFHKRLLIQQFQDERDGVLSIELEVKEAGKASYWV